MKTITGTTKAWFTNDIYGPDDLAREGAKLLGALGYINNDMTAHGWSCIGTADITLTLIDEDQMVANKVESLRQEITKTRADAEMKVRLLEGKVQSLLAITHEAPTTEGL